MTISNNFIFSGNNSLKIFDAPSFPTSNTQMPQMNYFNPKIRIIHDFKKDAQGNYTVSNNINTGTWVELQHLNVNSSLTVAVTLKVPQATINSAELPVSITKDSTKLLEYGLTVEEQESGLFYITNDDGTRSINPLFDNNFSTSNNNIRKVLLNLLDEINQPTSDATTKNDVVYVLQQKITNDNGVITRGAEYVRVALTSTDLYTGTTAASLDSTFTDADNNETDKIPANIYFVHLIDPDDLSNVKAELLTLGGIDIINQNDSEWILGPGSDSNYKINFYAKGDENNCQLQLDSGARGSVKLLNNNLTNKLPTFLKFCKLNQINYNDPAQHQMNKSELTSHNKLWFISNFDLISEISRGTTHSWDDIFGVSTLETPLIDFPRKQDITNMKYGNTFETITNLLPDTDAVSESYKYISFVYENSSSEVKTFILVGKQNQPYFSDDFLNISSINVGINKTINNNIQAALVKSDYVAQAGDGDYDHLTNEGKAFAEAVLDEDTLNINVKTSTADNSTQWTSVRRIPIFPKETVEEKDNDGVPTGKFNIPSNGEVFLRFNGLMTATLYTRPPTGEDGIESTNFHKIGYTYQMQSIDTKQPAINVDYKIVSLSDYPGAMTFANKAALKTDWNTHRSSRFDSSLSWPSDSAVTIKRSELTNKTLTELYNLRFTKLTGTFPETGKAGEPTAYFIYDAGNPNAVPQVLPSWKWVDYTVNEINTDKVIYGARWENFSLEISNDNDVWVDGVSWGDIDDTSSLIINHSVSFRVWTADSNQNITQSIDRMVLLVNSTDETELQKPHVTVRKVTDGSSNVNDVILQNWITLRDEDDPNKNYENVSVVNSTINLISNDNSNTKLQNFQLDSNANFDTNFNDTNFNIATPQIKENQSSVLDAFKLKNLRALRYEDDGSRNVNGLILRNKTKSNSGGNYAIVSSNQHRQIIESKQNNGVSSMKFIKGVNTYRHNMAVLEFSGLETTVGETTVVQEPRQFDLFVTSITKEIHSSDGQGNYTEVDATSTFNVVPIEDIELTLDLGPNTSNNNFAQSNKTTQGEGSVDIDGDSITNKVATIIGFKNEGDDIAKYTITAYVNMSNLDLKVGTSGENDVDNIFTFSRSHIVPWIALEHSANPQISNRNFKSDTMQIIVDADNVKLVDHSGADAYFHPTNMNNWAQIGIENEYVHGKPDSNLVNLITGASALNNFLNGSTVTSAAADFVNNLNFSKMVTMPSYNGGSWDNKDAITDVDSSSIPHYMNTLKNTLENQTDTIIDKAFIGKNDIYNYVYHILNEHFGGQVATDKIVGSKAFLGYIRELAYPINGTVSTIKAQVERLYPEIKSLFDSIGANRTPNYKERCIEQTNAANGTAALNLGPWLQDSTRHNFTYEDPATDNGDEANDVKPTRGSGTTSLWDAMWRWHVYDGGSLGTSLDNCSACISLDENNTTTTSTSATNVFTTFANNCTADNAKWDVNEILSDLTDLDYGTNVGTAENPNVFNGVTFKGLLENYGYLGVLKASRTDGQGLFDSGDDVSQSVVKSRLESNTYLPNYLVSLFQTTLKAYRRTSDLFVQTILGKLNKKDSSHIFESLLGTYDAVSNTYGPYNIQYSEDFATQNALDNHNFTNLVGAGGNLDQSSVNAHTIAYQFRQNIVGSVNYVPTIGTVTAGTIELTKASDTTTNGSSKGILNDLASENNSTPSSYQNNTADWTFGDNFGTYTQGTDVGIKRLFNDGIDDTANGGEDMRNKGANKGTIYSNQNNNNLQSFRFHIEYAINRAVMNSNHTHGVYNSNTQTFSIPISREITTTTPLSSLSSNFDQTSDFPTVGNLRNKSVKVDGTSYQTSNEGTLPVTVTVKHTIEMPDKNDVTKIFNLTSGDDNLTWSLWESNTLTSQDTINSCANSSYYYNYLQQATLASNVLTLSDSFAIPVDVVYNKATLLQFLEYSTEVSTDNIESITERYVASSLVHKCQQSRYSVIFPSSINTSNGGSEDYRLRTIKRIFFTFSSSSSEAFNKIDASSTGNGNGSIKNFINYLAGDSGSGRYIKRNLSGPDVIVVPYLWRCTQSLRISQPNLTNPNLLVDASLQTPQVQYEETEAADRKFMYLNNHDMISLKIMGKYVNPSGGFKSEYEDLVYIKDILNVNSNYSTDLIELHKHIQIHFTSGATQPTEPSSDIINMQSGSVNWNSDDIKRWKNGQEQTTATTIAINMMKQMDANLLTSTGLYAEDKARQIINTSDKVATHFEHYETLFGFGSTSDSVVLKNHAKDQQDGPLVLYDILRNVQKRTADLNSLPVTAIASANNLGFSSTTAPDLSIEHVINTLEGYNNNLVSLKSDFVTTRDGLLYNNTNSYTNLVDALRKLQTDQNVKLHELQVKADEFNRNITNIKNKLSNLIGDDSDHTDSNFLDNTYKSTFHGVVARGNKNIKDILTQIKRLDQDLQVREDELNKQTIQMQCWFLKQQGHGTEGMTPLPDHCS